MGGAILDTPGGEIDVDYFRLCDPWCGIDFADSVRAAQAFLKIRFRLCGRDRVQQQYRGLTPCLQ